LGLILCVIRPIRRLALMESLPLDEGGAPRCLRVLTESIRYLERTPRAEARRNRRLISREAEASRSLRKSNDWVLLRCERLREIGI